MFCSKCGVRIGSDDKFCRGCGENVDRDDVFEFTVQTEGEEDGGVEWDGSGLFCGKCGAEALETDIVCRFCESKLIPKRITDEADVAEDDDTSIYDAALSDENSREKTQTADDSCFNLKEGCVNMFCQRCGKEQVEGALFCISCGQDLNNSVCRQVTPEQKTPARKRS